jgi:hypothetical protein
VRGRCRFFPRLGEQDRAFTAADELAAGHVRAGGDGPPAHAFELWEAHRLHPVFALGYLGLAIRHLHDSGNTAVIRAPLASLTVFLDRLGRYEPAATISGFALSPLTAVSLPQFETVIAHLRDVLGDQTYQSLARKGETMTTAAMVTYAYDQIDQARTGLERAS